MINIMGIEYITEKEAAMRYAYSRSWFQRQRLMNTGPNYCRLVGKILYPLTKCDQWFKDNLKEV